MFAVSSGHKRRLRRPGSQMEHISGRMENKEKGDSEDITAERTRGCHQNSQNSLGFFLLLNADKSFKLWPARDETAFAWAQPRRGGVESVGCRHPQKQPSYVERRISGAEGKAGCDSRPASTGPARETACCCRGFSPSPHRRDPGPEVGLSFCVRVERGEPDPR